VNLNFRIIESLNDQELCLFEEKIRFIWKKLQPGFSGKINYTDENIFQDFALQANGSIDQVCEIFNRKIFDFSS
jgi:hypothetical protein